MATKIPADERFLTVTSSSNLDSFYYDGASLWVRFLLSDKTYEYEGVPQEEFLNLVVAPSRGEYLARVIKPGYKVVAHG